MTENTVITQQKTNLHTHIERIVRRHTDRPAARPSSVTNDIERLSLFNYYSQNEHINNNETATSLLKGDVHLTMSRASNSHLILDLYHSSGIEPQTCGKTKVRFHPQLTPASCGHSTLVSSVVLIAR